MAIDWKKFETVFRLLAAVHAALGEDAFKGKFGQIAEFFGPEASYDAVKSEWKKVVRLGDDLRRRRCGQPHGTRATESTFPRRRQRHPRVNTKPETHEIIDLADTEDFPNYATRKHKLDTNDVSPETESYPRDRTKRVRIDPELTLNVVRNGDTGPDDEVDYHTLPGYSDDLFEQIRRAVSETPFNNTTSDLPIVISSATVTEPSAVRLMATMPASRSNLDQNVSFHCRERSHCQVSITEHDRQHWETVQPPPLAMATVGELHAQSIRETPEAGPSRITSNGYAEAYLHKDRAQLAISLSSSDEDNTQGTEAGKETHAGASTAQDKGKSRMVTPSPRHVYQDPTFSMPPTVSYADPVYGICYLCAARFSTLTELRAHERGRYHSNKLTENESLEKAQARLEKYGLFQQFCSQTEKYLMHLPPARDLDKVQGEPRTIIRGQDRAVDIDEHALEHSSSQDVIEVSKTKASTNRDLGKKSGRARLKRPRATTLKKRKSQKKGKIPEVVVSDSIQMARILQLNKFHRSRTVDRVLTVLGHALSLSGSANNKTAPKCLDQFSSQTPTQLPPHSASAGAAGSCRFPTTRARPNIWIVDAEYANLKGLGNRYDFSVNVTNLISGNTIVNHRLELSIPVNELEMKILASGNKHAKDQFGVHYSLPCSMPIINPRQLARMLKSGGFGPQDFVFVWHTGKVDYDVIRDFLARQGVQHALMPPEDNVVRVLYAWRELLPKVSCRLKSLFELVYPDSRLNYAHHIADVDTKKLGLMTWKLRDLIYVPHGQQTTFNLFE